MKKRLIIVLPVIFIICFGVWMFINSDTRKSMSSHVSSRNTKYSDGVYEGKSDITSEGYYGKVKLKIKNDRITDIDFNIYDTAVFKTMGEHKDLSKKERLLDKSYGDEVYKDMPQYRQQTMNELSGIKEYKEKLLKVQDPEKVDLISGATWSLGIFKDTVRKTLDKTRK